MMNKQCKTARFLVITACAAAALLVVCLPPAHAKTLNSDAVIFAWMQNSGVLADLQADPEALSCLFLTAITAYGEFATCDDDDVCKAQVIYFNILDAILCVYPDAENVGILGCASDAVLAFISQGTSCGENNYVCNLLNLTALLRALGTCFDSGAF